MNFFLDSENDPNHGEGSSGGVVDDPDSIPDDAVVVSGEDGPDMLPPPENVFVDQQNVKKQMSHVLFVAGVILIGLFLFLDKNR